MDKPYVFISYAHLDSSVVLPCVKAMKEDGIELWFDEGIEAGSEWPEYIAEKVAGCTKFVLFVSKAYLNSQNCKRELNFAISRKKDILSIFTEDVQLSPGMEMQLGTYQAIYKKRFAGDTAFYNSLFAEGFFNACRPGGPKSVPNPAQPRGPVNSYVNPHAGKTENPNNPFPTENPFAGMDNSFPSVNNSRPQQPANNYTRPQQPVNNYTRPQQPANNYAQPQQPVNNYTRPQQNANPFAGVKQAPTNDPPTPPRTNANLPARNRIVAAVLAIFLGGLSIHRFYLGDTRKAIILLVLSILGCFGLFPLIFISIIMNIVDGIRLFKMTDREFEQKYNCRAE